MEAIRKTTESEPVLVSFEGDPTQVACQKYVLPYRFDVLVEDEEEDPSSTQIVDGPLCKLEFTPHGDGIEEMNLIITEKMFRLYAGSDEIDLINDLPLVQFPIAAIDTIV